MANLKDLRTTTDPNTVGDSIVSGSQLGVGTTENLSTLTVRARPQLTLSGTLSKTQGTATVTGTSTKFLSELSIGDRITLGTSWDSTKAVVAIESDTQLTVDSSYLYTETDSSVQASPSAARFDDHSGNAQVVVNDQGNVGIGTAGPLAQLEVRGTGAGDMDGCPIGVRVHSPLASDAWPLVMETEYDGTTAGVALWVTQLAGDGGATMTFSVYQGDNVINQDFIRIDGNGFHLQCQFTALPTSVSSNYTVAPADYCLLADAGTGGSTITLPPAVDSTGRVITVIKNGGTGIVSVIAHGTETINGRPMPQTITALCTGLHLFCDGGGWYATVMTNATSPVAVSVDYLISPTDDTVYVDAGAAGVTVTLPQVGPSNARTFSVIKTAGTGAVTVAAAAAETINGGTAAHSFTGLYGGLRLTSNGATWIATVMKASSSPVNVSGDYTIAPLDERVFVDADGAGRTITLPHSNVNGGRALEVFKTDATANAVTIEPVSGDTINGTSGSKTITAPYAGIRLTARAGSPTTWVATALPVA